MADDKTTDTKSTDTAAKPASTGGLKTDTYGKAAADTDLHATSGGYQVTPAGVSPEELQDRQDSRR
jgi:hypothetical protein